MAGRPDACGFTPEPPPLTINWKRDIAPMLPVSELYSLLASNALVRLSQEFLEWFDLFGRARMASYTEVQRQKMEQFATTFLALYVDDRYQIPRQFLVPFIEINPLIANFMACTSLGTTDAWIQILLDKKAPVEKLLILYSQRNQIDIDKDLLFAPDPELASHWYAKQRLTLRYPVDPNHFRKARSYFENPPGGYRIVSTDCIIAGYFAVTYLHPEYERHYKSWLISVIQRDCERITPAGNPDKKSIALISAKWVYGSSVHRALYPYFKSLKDKYRLTLVNIGPLDEEVDTTLFSEVRNFPVLRDPRVLSEEQRAAVTHQDWQIAFFPDVGMDAETIYLISQRVAPIQIVGYGHPSSTWSPNADYFFVGKDVECAEGVENTFSEQLIQLPGIGMHAIWPPFPCPDKRPEKPDDSPVVINCPWTAFKLAAPLISTLKQMISRSDRRLLFRIFGGPVILGLSAYPVYKRDIHRALGEDNVEFPTPVMFEDYNREMAKGDITLISYPFGGFTTVIDSIHLGIPVITRRGNQGYNSFPAELLKKYDLDELIAYSEEEYINKTVRLANDPGYLQKLRSALLQLDRPRMLMEDFDGTVFERAIEYVLVNRDPSKARPGKPVAVT